MMRHFSYATIFFVAGITSATKAGENWPGWRGPTGDGLTDEKYLPRTWNGATGENIRWKVALFPPGQVKRDQNQSSPIVWGERVFVTVSYWPDSASEKGFPEHHVVCFNARTGKKLWDKTVAPGPWKLSDLRGGYTCGTPATDGKQVYVTFGSAVVAALDFEGKLVWRRDITPHSFDVAWAASPVLFGDKVIVVCDQLGNNSTIYAFNANDGGIAWERKRPTVNWAHSTPLLTKIGGKLQLVTATHNGPQGLDPATGDILWTYRTGTQTGDTVTPTVRDGLVYIDSGRGGGGIAINATGQGDVSNAPPKWKIANVAQGFSSPILVGNYLYRLQGGDFITSWKWSTGVEAIKRERLDGVNTACSPIATANGLIYCASGGRSYVLRAGPTLDILARNDLDDPSQASPAAAAGRLYIKGGRFLWCIGEPRAK